MAKETRYLLVLDPSDFERGAKKAQAEWKDFLGTMSDSGGVLGRVAAAAGPVGAAVGAALGAAAVAATAMTTALAAAATKAVDMGGAMSDLSSKTGVSAEALQQLKLAGAGVGVSLEDVSGAIAAMQKELANSPESFRRLGLSAQDLMKMAPDKAFAEVAKAIQGIANPTLQAAAAMDVLGKGGAAALPLLKSYSEEAMASFRELGLVVSEETVAALDETGDQAGKLGQVWDGLVTNLGASIAKTPEVAAGFEAVANALGGLSRFVQENDKDIQALVKSAVVPLADILVALIKSTTTLAGGFVAVANKVRDLKGAIDSALPSLGGILDKLAKAGVLGSIASIAANVRGLTAGASGVGAGGATPYQPDVINAVVPVGYITKAQEEAARKAKEAADKAAKAWADALHFITVKTAAFEAKERQLFDQFADHVMSKVTAMAIARAAQIEAWNGIGKPVREITSMGYEPMADVLQKIQDRFEAAQDASVDWNRALESVAHTMQVLGISAESALGKIIGGFVAAAAGSANLKTAIGGFKEGLDAANVFSVVLKGQFGVGISTIDKLGIALKNVDWGAFIAGIGQVVGAFRQATDSASAFQRALGGAAVGASVGGQIGSLFGPEGKLIGSAIGAVAGGIAGLFSKPSWAKAGEEAGRVLGVAVSKEMAKEIEKTSKTLGISIANAALLSLPQVMGQGGRDARSFAGQVTQLMDAIRTGAVPAAQGMASLADAFRKVADEALNAGSVGDRALVGIILHARQAGQQIPEIQKFVAEQLAAAAQGVGGMVKGIQLTSEEDAKAQAVIFSAAFWAQVKESGLLAAADAFGAAFEGLSKKLKEGGFDVEAIFGPVREAMALAGNETFRGAAEGAQGLRQALEGIANAGYLTRDSFAAFGQQAQSAYDQALAGGASQQQALLAIAPLLQSLVSAAQNYGLTLDANTQRLVDQARENGITFRTDPMDRMVEVLEAIARVLGAELPAAADRFGRAVRDLPSEVSIPVSLELPDIPNWGNYRPPPRGGSGSEGGSGSAARGFAAGIPRLPAAGARMAGEIAAAVRQGVQEVMEALPRQLARENRAAVQMALGSVGPA